MTYCDQMQPKLLIHRDETGLGPSPGSMPGPHYISQKPDKARAFLKAWIGSITKISRNPTQVTRRNCKLQKPDQILLGPTVSMAKPEPDPYQLYLYTLFNV